MCGLAVDAALGDEDLMRGLAVDTDRGGVGGMGGGRMGRGGMQLQIAAWSWC